MKSESRVEFVAGGIAKGYSCRDGDGVVWLCSTAARGIAVVAGVWLCAISGCARESDESQCTATQEDATEFYRFPFDL